MWRPPTMSGCCASSTHAIFRVWASCAAADPANAAAMTRATSAPARSLMVRLSLVGVVACHAGPASEVFSMRARVASIDAHRRARFAAPAGRLIVGVPHIAVEADVDLPGPALCLQQIGQHGVVALADRLDVLAQDLHETGDLLAQGALVDGGDLAVGN